MTIQHDYVEKVYAGWLAKVIGVRHGGNIENWTYERIERTFGEITDYLHDFKNFAADDDTNGPIFFLRALEDYVCGTGITAEQMGLTWLNYAPDGHGFYWWGGYGKSTEHTAYLNLKNGIMAPRSGSIEQNGIAVAEQIGGQIFIDVWGLIAPGNPELAAHFAEKIASVSHDGNGKYGGMFIAACIAEAFVEQDIERIIESGLAVIPADCEYTSVTRAVIDFYKANPHNWRDAFHYVKANYGYDKYPGHCHIIPNSAVMILSLLYGEGDFSKTINICNMCGWDTDCNVANVATIMGVRGGIEAIDDKWRKPINDFLCCSSVIGSLNIMDIPWGATYIARLGYKLAGEQVPERWAGIFADTRTNFHFEYPGSTHAFRLEHNDTLPVSAWLENSDQHAASGSRSLKVHFSNVQGGCAYRVYHQTYYRPDDFNDSRYDPSFSPILYPGQTMEAKVLLPGLAGQRVKARLYVKDGNNGSFHYGADVQLTAGEWTQLQYQIPHLNGSCLEHAGIELVPMDGKGPKGPSLLCYVDDVAFGGKPNYTVDFAKERLEKWNGLHIEVSQLTYLRGIWTLEDGELSGSYSGEPAESYTGALDWADYEFEAAVVPKLGEHHRINFRVQGGIRSYAVGFAPGGKLALYKNDNGYRKLSETAYTWRLDQPEVISVKAEGSRFQVVVNGTSLIDYTDNENPYLTGMIGFSNAEGSHTHYRGFTVAGL
ncbi:ADP-ribosylglycohydrolase family protein [Paenibacillus thalictri]|uniref:ADP-ribosylglycohydrolase family protein n=1 Tax=Paenibacillus thalictri TaxID=2527873 RepID=A0A4Q9DKM8_9BACL|nr:ADP-ribosylglycohydrolase family protein [Paenibacillus thalictri]TBL74596.1 ADP-ribosylglycohydrolase family protein [Paenibacillus thalictri]